jgi:hypothetical protein
MNICTAEPRHPSENSWWVSRLMVFWITPLIQLASVQSLTEKDIWPCPKDKDIEYSTKVVRNAWSDEQKNNRGKTNFHCIIGCWMFLDDYLLLIVHIVLHDCMY